MTKPAQNLKSVSATTAAAHLCMTRKVFHEHVARGTLTPAQGGRGYDLDVIRKEYIEHLRRPFVEKAKHKAGELDPVAERARKDKELADRTALQNAQTRAELAPVADFQAILEDTFIRFRSRLLVLPAKLAPRFEGTTSAEAYKLLETEILGALHEIASTKYEPPASPPADPPQPDTEEK